MENILSLFSMAVIGKPVQDTSRVDCSSNSPERSPGSPPSTAPSS